MIRYNQEIPGYVSRVPCRLGDRSNTMPAATTSPPWTQPDWFEQASSWIHAVLAQQGIDITGPIEQVHVRPWSTVLRVPTPAGAVYFKASTAVLAHEAALTQALSRWRPGQVPQVLATNLQRGWMLMRDGGTRLREVLKVDRNLGHWETLLPLYAEVQMDLAHRLPDLLALGIPDRRMATLPVQFEELLTDIEVLRIDQPNGLTSTDYRRLRYLAPYVAALCDRLAASSVPESINHGDFHDGNIFLRDGRYVFFDWGDGSVSHPFFSLRTVFVSVEYTLQFQEDAPEFQGLRDAYLEPWTQVESREVLLRTFDLARRVAPISSALGWHRTLSGLEESLREDYAVAIPGLLNEFLDIHDIQAEVLG